MAYNHCYILAARGALILYVMHVSLLFFYSELDFEPCNCYFITISKMCLAVLESVFGHLTRNKILLENVQKYALDEYGNYKDCME